MRMPKYDYPCVLMRKEKHYNSFYLIRNLEELQSVSLKILQENDKQGFYEKDEKYYQDAKKECETIIAEVPKIGVENYHLKKAVEESKKGINECDKTISNMKWIKEALNNKDGANAYQILIYRSDNGFEYEEIEISQFANKPQV